MHTTSSQFSKTDPKGKMPGEDCKQRRFSSEGKGDSRAKNARRDYDANLSEEKIFNYEVENDQAESLNGTPLEDLSSQASGSGKIFLTETISNIADNKDKKTTPVTVGNWKKINSQLKNNDPSITSLKFEFLLLDNDLAELQSSIQQNTTMGYISWHEKQIYCRTVQNIEVKLVSNCKSFQHHPNDFTHILLSKHVYKNSQKGGPVKVDPSVDGYLKNWYVAEVYDDTNDSGYYGVIYRNDTTHQFVLAVRGTAGGAKGALKSLLQKNCPLKTNLEEILAGQIVIGQQARNYQATTKVLEIAKKERYALSFTGHSLGAWLAELSVFYSHAYSEYFKVKAVTFESPGTRPMMEKLQSNIVNSNTQVPLEDLKITTYLATPNPVNCCNGHVGEVYSVKVDMEWTDYAEQKTPDRIDSLVGDKIRGALAIEGHGLSKMLNKFDPQTGKPGKYKKMADWPRLEYQGEEKNFANNAMGLVREGIEEGVKYLDFDSSIATKIVSKTAGKLVSWLIGDRTIMTIIGFLKCLVTDEIDQEEYWAYFRHIGSEGSDNETSRKKINENFDHRFALIAQAKYRKADGTSILSLSTGSTDNYIFELYKNRFNIESLPRGALIHLENLLSSFKIKKLSNGKYLLIPEQGHDVVNIRQHTERLLQVIPKKLSFLATQLKTIELLSQAILNLISINLIPKKSIPAAKLQQTPSLSNTKDSKKHSASSSKPESQSNQFTINSFLSTPTVPIPLSLKLQTPPASTTERPAIFTSNKPLPVPPSSKLLESSSTVQSVSFTSTKSQTPPVSPTFIEPQSDPNTINSSLKITIPPKFIPDSKPMAEGIREIPKKTDDALNENDTSLGERLRKVIKGCADDDLNPVPVTTTQNNQLFIDSQSDPNTTNRSPSTPTVLVPLSAKPQTSPASNSKLQAYFSSTKSLSISLPSNPQKSPARMEVLLYEIANIKKLDALNTLLENRSKADVIDKIRIDFSSFKIEKDNMDSFIRLLNNISQNEKSLPNFNSLFIEDIEDGIEIEFPKLNNLKKLVIKKIGENVTLNLNECDELEELTIQMNSSGLVTHTELTLPKKLDNLKQLKLTKIRGSKLILPDKLDNLVSLTLGGISPCNKVILPSLLNNLTDLTFKHFEDVAWCTQLPVSLSSVKSLTIGYIPIDEPGLLDSKIKRFFFSMGATSLQDKLDFSLALLRIKWVNTDLWHSNLVAQLANMPLS